MASNNDFKVILEAMIDNSSLSNIQKQLAKERLKISADISIEDFAKSKQAIEKQIEALGKEIKSILGDSISDKQSSQWAKQYYNQMVSGAKQAAKEQENLVNAMAKGREQAELARQAEEKRQQAAQSKAINKALEEEYNQKQKIIAQEEKLAQVTAEKANKIQLSFDTGNYQSKVNSLVARTNQWVDANGNARISTESLQTALNNLGTAYTNLNSSGGNTVANQQALIEAEKALDIEVKKVQSSITTMNSTIAKSSAVDALRQKVQQFYDINTASHGKWGNSLKSIMSQLASGTEVPITKLKELERQFITIQNAARQAGKLGLSFFDTIKQGMSKFSYWTSSTFIIMKTVQEFKQMISNVEELDDALTNISYTMDVSNSQLEKIGNSALQTAKDLNTSASNVLDAVKTYANANETADSILNKAKPTIMMSNVTGMGTEQTVDIIQGTIEQFDLEDTEEQLMHISDVLQTVSMSMPYDFAKGVNELSEGIQASGSVAKDAGYDLENYTALLGTLIAKTRQSGSELGRSLRTKNCSYVQECA